MFLRVDGSDLTAGDLHVIGMEEEEGTEGTHVYFQVLNGSGIGGKQYTWYEFGEKGVGDEFDDWMYGWYDASGYPSFNDDPIPAGEGVWVTSDNTKYTIQSSGEVATAPIDVTLRGGLYSKLVSNPMPTQMKVGDIATLGMEGEEGTEGTHVYFQFLNGSGIGGKQYTWYEFGEKGVGDEFDDWMYGWYDASGYPSFNDDPLPAGESIWVTSDNTKYKCRFPSPIQKEVE